MKTLRPAFLLFAIFSVITGLAYPLLMTGVAQALFPWQANGSQVIGSYGNILGSEIIGQSFTEPKYFWGRFSATGDHPYNAATSGGTNFSVLNENLKAQVQARIDTLHAADPNNTISIPADLVTASASGLDPHISPAAAYYQVSRVARARGIPDNKIQALVQQHIESPFLGIFGEARVNVLKLNLALNSVQ
jgi:potassium-transporting ATPase KdpC subunit